MAGDCARASKTPGLTANLTRQYTVCVMFFDFQLCLQQFKAGMSKRHRAFMLYVSGCCLAGSCKQLIYNIERIPLLSKGKSLGA